MSHHPPPVPPAGRSSKGPGDPGVRDKDADTGAAGSDDAASSKTGRHANVSQNTRQQGYQQDR